MAKTSKEIYDELKKELAGETFGYEDELQAGDEGFEDLMDAGTIADDTGKRIPRQRGRGDRERGRLLGRQLKNGYPIYVYKKGEKYPREVRYNKDTDSLEISDVPVADMPEPEKPPRPGGDSFLGKTFGHMFYRWLDVLAMSVGRRVPSMKKWDDYNNAIKARENVKDEHRVNRRLRQDPILNKENTVQCTNEKETLKSFAAELKNHLGYEKELNQKGLVSGITDLIADGKIVDADGNPLPVPTTGTQKELLNLIGHHLYGNKMTDTRQPLYVFAPGEKYPREIFLDNEGMLRVSDKPINEMNNHVAEPSTMDKIGDKVSPGKNANVFAQERAEMRRKLFNILFNKFEVEETKTQEQAASKAEAVQNNAAKSAETQKNASDSAELQKNASKSEEIHTITSKSGTMVKEAPQGEENNPVPLGEQIAIMQKQMDSMRKQMEIMQDLMNGIAHTTSRSEELQTITSRSQTLENNAAAAETVQSVASKSGELENNAATVETVQSGTFKSGELQNNAAKAETVQNSASKAEEVINTASQKGDVAKNAPVQSKEMEKKSEAVPLNAQDKEPQQHQEELKAAESSKKPEELNANQPANAQPEAKEKADEKAAQNESEQKVSDEQIAAKEQQDKAVVQETDQKQQARTSEDLEKATLLKYLKQMNGNNDLPENVVKNVDQLAREAKNGTTALRAAVESPKNALFSGGEAVTAVAAYEATKEMVINENPMVLNMLKRADGAKELQKYSHLEPSVAYGADNSHEKSYYQENFLSEEGKNKLGQRLDARFRGIYEKNQQLKKSKDPLSEMAVKEKAKQIEQKVVQHPAAPGL